MSRYVQPACAAAAKIGGVQARIAGVEDHRGPLGGGERDDRLDVGRVDRRRAEALVAQSLDRAARALVLHVGEHEALEEPASAGDRGGGDSDTAGTDDEDAHASNLYVRRDT